MVNDVRTAVGAANVLLVDAGDEMQGSLLSNLGDGTATGKGIPTIAAYNAMGYNVATFGNHEFDWGQVNLAQSHHRGHLSLCDRQHRPRMIPATVPPPAGHPRLCGCPLSDPGCRYRPNTVKVAFIGVTTTETPTITVSTATAGLCFKDPAESIIHYYDAMKADGADVIVVLSHLGLCRWRLWLRHPGLR